MLETNADCTVHSQTPQLSKQMLIVRFTARHLKLAIMPLHAITIIRLSPSPPKKKKDFVSRLKLEISAGTFKLLINKVFSSNT
jgi:hypothetical protein